MLRLTNCLIWFLPDAKVIYWHQQTTRPLTQPRGSFTQQAETLIQDISLITFSLSEVKLEREELTLLVYS